jgi:hypothetical protein
MCLLRVLAVCSLSLPTHASLLLAQNLLANPGFAVDLSGWTTQGGSWTSQDAANSPTSGSVQLSDDPAPGVQQVFQCVAAAPGMYAARVKYRVPAGQLGTGFGVLRVVAFVGPNCTGGFLDGDEVDPQASAFDTWLQADLLARVPPGAQSASFQIFFQSDQPAGSFTGLFDDAFLAPGDSGLLLGQFGRFLVEATWETSQPLTGDGHGVLLTADTGYFWFFNSANVEAVVKVLDGCGVNNHFWVFAAGLTNVEVVLTVTDQTAQTVKTYTNPLNQQFAPIQDTSAFPCS